MNQESYNQQLTEFLTGRYFSGEKTVLNTMGDALGFPEGDVHATRFYRIFLTLSRDGCITDVRVVVDGELISPCSGYFPEVLDEFDYLPVKHWCEACTRPGISEI